MLVAENVAYWDTSAILSALFRDVHSEQAIDFTRDDGYHFITTFGWAEAHAVINRIEREGAYSAVLVDSARNMLESGPWRRINAAPDWIGLTMLARRWSLRGADLWHLATAKNLKMQLPTLTLFSFDQRLNEAAAGEGLIVGPG